MGGTRVGLALWLLIWTTAIWGVTPAMATRKRRDLLIATIVAWAVLEGIMYRGELVLFPVVRVAIAWPERISHWLSDPVRWAVPLEVLVTATAVLVLLTWVRAALRGSTGHHRP
jgi:hypothetical protein